MEKNIYEGVPTGPHTETNEDGTRYQHQGYEIRNCKKCKKDYLSSRISLFAYCGGMQCDGDNKAAV